MGKPHFLSKHLKCSCHSVYIFPGQARLNDAALIKNYITFIPDLTLLSVVGQPRPQLIIVIKDPNMCFHSLGAAGRAHDDLDSGA